MSRMDRDQNLKFPSEVKIVGLGLISNLFFTEVLEGREEVLICSDISSY